MNRQEVERQLADIFMQRFAMDTLSKPDMKLLGQSGIPARELLHIYYDVKNIFNISIPEDDVARGRFDTFTHIADIIEEQLQNRES